MIVAPVRPMAASSAWPGLPTGSVSPHRRRMAADKFSDFTKGVPVSSERLTHDGIGRGPVASLTEHVVQARSHGKSLSAGDLGIISVRFERGTNLCRECSRSQHDRPVRCSRGWTLAHELDKQTPRSADVGIEHVPHRVERQPCWSDHVSRRRPITAPAPVRRVAHEPRGHRVEHDIQIPCGESARRL
jgi:hypothetical protein